MCFHSLQSVSKNSLQKWDRQHKNSIGGKNLNLDRCFTNSSSSACWSKYSQAFQAGIYSSGAYLGQDDLSLPFDGRPLVVDCEYARLHLAPTFFVTQDEQWFVLSFLRYPWWREARPVLSSLWCSWNIRTNMLFLFLNFIFLCIFFCLLLFPSPVLVTIFSFYFMEDNWWMKVENPL